MRSEYEEFIYRYGDTWLRHPGMELVVYINEGLDDVEYEDDECGIYTTVLYKHYDSSERMDFNRLSTVLPEPGYYHVGERGVVLVEYPPSIQYKRGFLREYVVDIKDSTHCPFTQKVKSVFGGLLTKTVPSRETYISEGRLYFNNMLSGVVEGRSITITRKLKPLSLAKLRGGLRNVGYDVIWGNPGHTQSHP